MNHEILAFTVKEVKETIDDAAKRGAIWAVDPSGNRRPLAEATSLLMNLRLVLQSGTPGLIEQLISHTNEPTNRVDNQKPTTETPTRGWISRIPAAPVPNHKPEEESRWVAVGYHQDWRNQSDYQNYLLIQMPPKPDALGAIADIDKPSSLWDLEQARKNQEELFPQRKPQ